MRARAPSRTVPDHVACLFNSFAGTPPGIDPAARPTVPYSRAGSCPGPAVGAGATAIVEAVAPGLDGGVLADITKVLCGARVESAWNGHPTIQKFPSTAGAGGLQPYAVGLCSRPDSGNPTAFASLTRTRLTRAAGGPRSAQATRSATRAGAPATRASTVPSRRFRTHPRRPPIREAWSTMAQR